MKKGWKAGGKGRERPRKKYLHEGEHQHASDQMLLTLTSYRTIHEERKKCQFCFI